MPPAIEDIMSTMFAKTSLIDIIAFLIFSGFDI